MANNFKNAFATSVSTNSASPTDVYTSNNGSVSTQFLSNLILQTQEHLLFK